jgi:hypothetical protein
MQAKNFFSKDHPIFYSKNNRFSLSNNTATTVAQWVQTPDIVWKTCGFYSRRHTRPTIKIRNALLEGVFTNLS